MRCLDDAARNGRGPPAVPRCCDLRLAGRAGAGRPCRGSTSDCGAGRAEPAAAARTDSRAYPGAHVPTSGEDREARTASPGCFRRVVGSDVTSTLRQRRQTRLPRFAESRVCRRRTAWSGCFRADGVKDECRPAPTRRSACTR